MNSLKSISFYFCFLATAWSYGQNVAINNNGSLPDGSAMLDVSSSTQGVLVPRMTAADRISIANPANGLLIYQVGVDSGFYFNGGTATTPNWLRLNTIADTSALVQDADGDTRIETEANADEDIIRFTTNGTQFFNLQNGRINVLNTGSSVFLGDRAGENDDLSSNSSTLIGSFAGNQLTTGFGNTAIGANSLANATTQGSNTAVGFNALRSNIGIENTAVGYQSLAGNTSNANVAMGYFSLNSNVLGADNVAIGYDALRNNLGSRNVALGYRAGANETGSDKLYIENSNSASPLIYGDFANDSIIMNGFFKVNSGAQVNSLRINTSNLQFGASLEVSDRINIIGPGNPALFMGPNGSNYLYLDFVSASGYGRIFTPGTNDIVLDAGGNVGIGLTNPSSELEVAGDIEIPATNDYTYSTAKTRYASIPPSAFVSVRPESYELNPLGVILYISIGGTGGAVGWASAPINTIPNGARITDVTYYYYDNDAAVDLNLSLVRYGNTATGGVAYAGFGSSGSTSTYQSGTSNTNLPITVDYENFYYQVYLTGRQGNSDLRLKNVVIEYTVTEAD